MPRVTFFLIFPPLAITHESPSHYAVVLPHQPSDVSFDLKSLESAQLICPNVAAY